MACLSSLNYTMKADIYKPMIEQDEIGAVKKTYVYEKTIGCFARTDIKKGMGANSDTMNMNDYINYLSSFVKLRTSEVVPTNRRIVNLRNDDGVIWKESQDTTSAGGYNGSTIFEPRGSTPIINFDGSIVEYEVILSRQEVQRLD